MYRKIFSLIIIAPIISFAMISAVAAKSQYNIKEMTPAIEEALINRRNRNDQLSAFQTQGIIGENNQGYVEVLKSNAEAKKLTEVENRDRRIIYKAIAEQNGLTDALSTIEKVFAQVQRDKAQPGEMIQMEDGKWVKK